MAKSVLPRVHVLVICDENRGALGRATSPRPGVYYIQLFFDGRTVCRTCLRGFGE